MGKTFSVDAFYAAIDAIRKARGINWKQVANEAEVSASTLSRMQNGKKPDVDGLASLLSWSNLKAETFISGHSPSAEPKPIAQIASLIRMDQSLTLGNAQLMEDIVVNTYNRLSEHSGRAKGRK